MILLKTLKLEKERKTFVEVAGFGFERWDLASV